MRPSPASATSCPRGPERLDTSGLAQGNFFLRHFPYALGGVEDPDTAASARLVLLFWWPIQPGEWHLYYGYDRGFTVFVVANQGIFEASAIPAYASIHREIRERCKLLDVLPSSRMLHDEG